ncbi:MAG: hypothetical protein J1E39_09175 [Eubacterium sp.]|nr:hypothetical protein [Eubacterium sp.]
MAKNLDNAVLLDIYGAMLTEKQYDALNAYYNEDFSLAEIAENSGITRQGVHKSICAAQDYLAQLEDALGCARKYREISDTLDDMQKTVGGAQPELAALIEKIRNIIYS